MAPFSRFAGMATVAISAKAFLRSEHRRIDHATLDEDADFPEMWYKEQTLDHFDASNNGTWAQRYYVNFEHYTPGGPVFLYIGGEGPLSSSSVSGRTSNAYFAERYGGATVALEHRFYGKSQPFDSLATEHLPLLTSRQALHDLKQFSDYLISQKQLGSSKWFCMGGSYPGNLASWYRLEFPDATAGCWAASAPVHAQEDWPGYGQMVWRALSTTSTGEVDESLTTKLYAGYQQLATLIQEPSASSVPALEQALNACPGSIVSQQDRDNWEFWLMDSGVSGVVQYNSSRPPHIASIRDLAAKGATPLEAALSVVEYLNMTQGDCVDNSINAFYNQLGNATLPASGVGNSGRTWTWQTCNEFGYFQTSTAVWGKTSLYTRGASSRAIWQGVCSDLFGIAPSDVSSRIAATNAYYGGRQPKGISKVVYSNGQLDPWSLLSILPEDEVPADTTSVVGELGSHCVGLYAPEAGELPGATVVRDHVIARLEEWGVNSSSELTVFL